MDGGRILGAVDRNFLLAGLGVGGYIAYAHTPMNPIFYLILLSSGYNTYQRFFGQSELPPSYYDMSNGQRMTIGTCYMLLVAGLLMAHSINAKYKKSPAQLRGEPEPEMFFEQYFESEEYLESDDDPWRRR